MNNFVARELAVCPVCGKPHMTGILVHRYLEEIEDQVTHYDFCEEHQKLIDDGYVFLIEIDPTRSDINSDNTVFEDKAFRTGRIITAKKECFDIEIKGLAFIDEPTFNALEMMANHNIDELS